MVVDEKLEELDWVKVRQELDEIYVVESLYAKAKRKIQENPLVPIGCFATTAALTIGLFNFYRGKSQMQQYMMRARVGAQAFTIVSMVIGLLLLSKPKNM